MEVLKVESLSKNFGGVHALRNLSFSVEEGERLAIIGPNGAGKTTLFNLISGLLLATGGRIYFLGRDITNMPPSRHISLGVARSFQIPSLFLPLTVMENILMAFVGDEKWSRFQMFRSIKSYKHMIAKADKLLATWDLYEKRNEVVQNLSYGEIRKLEIAISVVSKPKLLLLDEPSSGLAPEDNINIINMIRLLEADITVIMVAHDMDLVFGVARRIAVLHYGQLIADGTPEEINDNPIVNEVYMGIE